MENKDAFKFSGKDAENYDFYLGPMFFEPYGKYLASQIDLKGLTHGKSEAAQHTCPLPHTQ